MNEFENNPLDLLASVEAEQNIIGGLLLEPTAMAKCRNLTAEKFYQVRHRIIFAALKAMAAENLPIDVVTAHERLEFQLTAARRRLVVPALYAKNPEIVSTHSRPKAAGHHRCGSSSLHPVSTHSRPKAAGATTFKTRSTARGFNSQPPEGGWGHRV